MSMPPRQDRCPGAADRRLIVTYPPLVSGRGEVTSESADEGRDQQKRHRVDQSERFFRWDETGLRATISRLDECSSRSAPVIRVRLGGVVDSPAATTGSVAYGAPSTAGLAPDSAMDSSGTWGAVLPCPACTDGSSSGISADGVGTNSGTVCSVRDGCSSGALGGVSLTRTC